MPGDCLAGALVAEYRLDELGWFQFERLCQSLLKARCGLGVEAWGGRGDLGRDAYAEGPLRFPGEEENQGPFVFQAKFVADANAAGAKPMRALMKGVRAELAEIAKREAKGVWEAPRFYALLTNTPLTVARRKEVKKALEKGLEKTTTVTILGAGDIDGMLDDSRDTVRLAFPQILGLRDIFALLDKTVNKDIINRSKVALSMGAELAKTFVATGAYEEALEVLRRRHFVVLTGPPEMGKTTIARIVALARLSEGWEAYECRGPNDLLRVHDVEKPQVFVADDAFGSTEYQPEKGSQWADELERILQMLDARHWLLLTSRPAPLRTALEKLYLQGAAEDFPKPQEVIVNASKLTEKEKAQMLYRHAKNSVGSEEGRALIAKHAVAMVRHKDFTPLRIRHFVTQRLPEITELPEAKRQARMERAVIASMAEPTASMKTSFAGLHPECRALLIAMLDSHESTISLKEELAVPFERHLGQAPHRSVLANVQIVDEHFVRLTHWEDLDATEPSHVEWVHPSVRDMVIGHLMDDAAARRDFLGRAGIDGIMLALSSSGGAEGKRQFPLLEGEPEWEEIEGRVLELVRGGRDEESGRLLALFGDTARLSGSVADRAQRSRLATLSANGLGALRGVWESSGVRITYAELRDFYRASASLPEPIKGPELGGTWARCVEETRGSLGGFIDNLAQRADEWLGVATLLKENDPQQLEHFSFPADYGELLEKIVEKLKDEEEMLESPAIFNEDDPEEYGEESPDLDWTNGIEELLIAVANFSPPLKDRCEILVDALFTKAGEWEEYSERYIAFNEPEPDYDREGGGRQSGGDGSFSVASVFSDL
jgi:hypothetical protein